VSRARQAGGARRTGEPEAAPRDRGACRRATSLSRSEARDDAPDADGCVEQYVVSLERDGRSWDVRWGKGPSWVAISSWGLYAAEPTCWRACDIRANCNGQVTAAQTRQVAAERCRASGPRADQWACLARRTA